MIKVNEVKYNRQLDLINMKRVVSTCVTVIGAGAIGSFTTLELAKLGVEHLAVYDDDSVSVHNGPNQFYRVGDTRQFKVHALYRLIADFANIPIRPHVERFKKNGNYNFGNIVVLATDNMKARKEAWQYFKNKSGTETYGFIDARMGGLLGKVYCIRKNANGVLSREDSRFYEETLYSDAEAEEQKCTEKAIIYNVLMISSLIGRAFASLIDRDAEFPRELVFDMKNLIFMDRR